MDNVTPLWPRRKRAAGAKVSRRHVSIGAIAALVFVLLVIAARALGFYTDWLWFGEVNLRVVFWRSFWWQLGVGAAFGTLFFIVVYVNLLIARRLAPRFKTSGHEDLVEFAPESVQRLAGWLGLGIALVIGLIAGIAASSSWLTFARATHSVAFGIKDPIFHHDLSFYVFALPAWHFVQSFFVAAVIVAMLASAAMHLVLGGIEYTVGAKQRAAAGEAEHGGPHTAAPRGLGPRPSGAVPDINVRLQGRAVAHLSALLGLVFVLVGIGQLFKAWNLLYSKAGVVFGAGYTDVHARLPIIRIEMAICFVLAAALFVNVWRRRQYWPAAVAVWVVLLILLQGIVPALMQSLIVNPNQLAKEGSYIADNIAATRTAYNLNEIAQQPLAMNTAITTGTLATNDVTVRNIRLWDPKTLVTSYIQLQQQRPYYNFVDADVDRYTVNGVYRQTMLSPRELDISGLPATAQTWVNQHITYTHGYGVAVSAVNEFAPDGSPKFLVQDMPVQSVPGLEITEPRIYFGEIGTGYSLVKTKVQEFDYPGPSDVYQSYQGTGGIPISSVLNRLAFGVRFGTIKFFTASAIDSDSRIIIRNNIADRLKTAAPFLKFDKDSYMVISGGRLYWIADAYTTTDLYPYSTPQGDLNYIRNSVKVVIDAYNGNMTFYAFDASDPLLRAYERIFPGMFTPAAQMPADLLKHVRYPEDYFTVQSQVFATYHVNDPSVLYNKGDQWQIPEGVALSGAGPMDPYYVILKLPGATQEEFLLMVPFVPNGRDNMVSWLGAESDPPNYGKAVNFVFGKSTTVYGPAQVEAAINQDATVSSQRTLWDQAGSTVIMGNLVIVPIEQTLLYVQPLFLQSQQTKLPQLKRVIVFYRAPSTDGSQGGGRQVVSMQPTLSAALAEIFGAAPTTPTTGGPTPPPNTTPGTGGLSAQARQLIAQADQQFKAAVTAQRAGDWAEYGRQIQLLQQTLSQLQQLR
jgi:uncharacterized membrane protein (UPF0182 family)